MTRNLSLNLSPLLKNAVIILTQCTCLHKWSDFRAWTLLKAILDPAKGLRVSLPAHIVHWIEDESKQENLKRTVPSSIEEMEKEIKKFQHQGINIDTPEGDTEMWTNGWKKWEGNWTPQAMGTVL
jgi:hypothetical protein